MAENANQNDSSDVLRTTPLDSLHRELGGKMVPFTGYSMPLNYGAGILKEHLHCREKAGLFDVSHMGQVALIPRSGHVKDAALALESLVPVDVLGLAQGRQRYGFFTNDFGGIEDDLMIANGGDHLMLVVNAANKDEDAAHLGLHLGETCEVTPIDRALLALQGPAAAGVLAAMAPEAAEMRFMDVRELTLAGAECIVSRSGYTGEDGFEISVSNDQAMHLAKALLSSEEVEPIGLGARDSLRLEAGLCLHGNDINRQTSPIEAGLTWAIQKVRRAEGDRAGGFLGETRIMTELDQGPMRRRVGLRPEGRAPIRAKTTLHATEDGPTIGTVTSGVFGPSIAAPVAMGYVPPGMAAIGTQIFADVRGKRMPVTITKMPFIEPGYKR